MKKTNLAISLMLVIILTLAFISCAEGSKVTTNDAYYEPSPDYSYNEKGDSMINIETFDYSKIIKTVTAYGETKAYDECIEAIKSLVIVNGGYVESSSVLGVSYGATNYNRRASFVFRIPAERLEAFKADVSSTLNITSINENVQNVSEEYYNIEAIIETLEAEREGLLNILKSLDNSTQYEYWIKITERLSDIEKQIAIYKAQLNNLDNKIAYSTFSLTVYEVIEYTESAPEKFGDRISSTAKKSWKNFAENLQDFIVGLVYLIPTFLVLGVIGGMITGIILLSTRKYRRK